jgi:phospholipid-binding lipoprotein MlaA
MPSLKPLGSRHFRHVEPVCRFSKGDDLMNSPHKVLIAVSAFLLVSLILPAQKGKLFSLISPASPSLALAAAPSQENDEEPEPFAETAKTEYAPDPLESVNRAFFQFNDKLYFWFLKPVSQIYGIFIPPGIRTCIRNGFDNLRYPSRFVNNVLQGKFKAAGIETGRFLINSTLGFAGFFEIASRDFGLLPPHDEDTGQTLGFYGLKPGFYIVWPVFGPSTVRDSFGLGGDAVLNPIWWIPGDLWVSVAIRGGIIVNNTSLRIGEYEDFKKAAVDPYASMRQAYLQYRQNDILK